MRQFVLPPGYDGESTVRISGSDSKYILKVLRLGAGSSFPAVDHAGRRYTLKITETETGSGGGWFSAECRPAGSQPQTEGCENTAEKTSPDIILIQCLPKGKKLETIVRQAVEAGTAHIIPVESAFSIARISDDRNDKKTARLNKIAEEAAQQSGNSGVPEIHEAVKMSQLPAFLEQAGINGIKLFFHQERLEKGSLHGYLNSGSSSICILIGPEGGLSAAETDFLLASGFYPVYLGENILRTETAAIYALGAVKTILLENDEWKTDIRE